MLPDFSIENKNPLTNILLSLGVKTFHEALSYVHDLPYGRNSERANPILVLTENKGTCSTKHACLKQIAEDHGYPEIELIIGIYRMNGYNTPGIGEELAVAKLDFIPEAHCYLRFGGKRYDYTGLGGDFSKIKADLLTEEAIIASQVGVYKVEAHRKYISKWLAKSSLTYNFDQVWAIREACIQRLSE